MVEKIPASEITTKVENQESASASLFNQMDDDFKLWDLETTAVSEYTAGTKSTIGAHDTDIEITSNDPRTFANHVQARLSAAEMQIIVRMAEKEGDDKRDDTAKLERLFHFALENADDRLSNLLLSINDSAGNTKLYLSSLLDAEIWLGMIRAWMAARILVYKGDDGKVVFDFLPLDRRWLSYEMGGNGISWAASKMFLSKAQIEDEWEYKGALEKQNNTVLDYWKVEAPGKIRNSVIFNKEYLKDEVHDIPSIPLLILPISGGNSIFAPNRHVNEIINKLLSIWATHANLLAKQPMINYQDKDAGGIQLQTTSYLAEAVLNLPMGKNKLEPAPMKEISPTLVNLVGYLGSMRQRGALPDVEYGELHNIPLSGTAINELQQARDKVFGPLLKGLGVFYSGICRLIEEQLLYGKLKVNVKSEKERKYYEVNVTPVDLKKPHIIRVEFTGQTPWTQLDTYQIADMAKRLGLPDEFIWEHILKLADPKGMSDQAAVEIAEHSPTLMRVKAISTLLKQGRKDEAEALIKQLYQEQMEPEGAVQ